MTRASTSRDHPRACGEHVERRSTVVCDVGSSPRLRGTRTNRVCAGCWLGIIPALAGNTLPSQPPVRLNRDHPRACGEHMPRACGMRLCAGSSPRLRGTRQHSNHSGCRSGIIPALAGNTLRPAPRRCGRRDHPRACGEHYRLVKAICRLVGSSPRLRGTPFPPVQGTQTGGIIPALAGNTALRP